jgi:hypothetical protein
LSAWEPLVWIRLALLRLIGDEAPPALNSRHLALVRQQRDGTPSRRAAHLELFRQCRYGRQRFPWQPLPAIDALAQGVGPAREYIILQSVKMGR